MTEITQPSGAVVEWVTYDVYGAPTIRDQNGVGVSQSAAGNPYLFTGRELDPETGLFFYRARHYDSGTGRFLQRDPLGYPDGPSAHQYCVSSPATLEDALGLDTYNPGENRLPHPAHDASGLEHEREALLKDKESTEADIGSLRAELDGAKEEVAFLRALLRYKNRPGSERPHRPNGALFDMPDDESKDAAEVYDDLQDALAQQSRIEHQLAAEKEHLLCVDKDLEENRNRLEDARQRRVRRFGADRSTPARPEHDGDGSPDAAVVDVPSRPGPSRPGPRLRGTGGR